MAHSSRVRKIKDETKRNPKLNEIDSASLNDLDTDIDDLFTILSSRHRRYVLSYLQSMDDAVAELPELVEWVLTQKADCENDHQETVAGALHHIHLPKLAEVGLIDYDAPSNTIRFDRHPDREQLVALAVEMASDIS